MANKMITKKNYVFNSFGFPVELKEAKLIETKFGVGLDPKLRSKIKNTVLKYFTTEATHFLGAHIKFIRKYLQLTQEEFASKLGVNRTTLLGWEKTNLDYAPLSKAEVLLIKAILSRGNEYEDFKPIKPAKFAQEVYQFIDSDFTRKPDLSQNQALCI